MDEDAIPRRHIDRICRSVQSALDDNNSDDIQRGLDIYRLLVDEYLQFKEEFAAPIADELSVEKQLLGPGPIGSEQIDWLRSNYHDILTHTFEACEPTRESIRHVLYFPFSVAARSVKHADETLLDALFPSYGSNPYRFYDHFSDWEMESFIVERIGRYPCEFANFHVGRAVDEAEFAADIAYLQTVAFRTLKLFSALLKQSFDANERGHFDTFWDFLQESFSSTWWNVRGYDQWRISRRLNESRQDRLPKPDEYYEAYEKFRNAIQSRKNLIEFGLQAWVLRQYFDGELLLESTSEWVNKFEITNDINRLLSQFDDALSALSSGEFGWKRWVSETWSGVGVRGGTVDFDVDLARVVVTKGLQLAEGQLGEYRPPDDFEKAESLAMRCRDGGTIREVFHSLLEEDHFDRLSSLIGEVTDNQTQAFRGLLDEIVDRFAELETEQVLDAELDGGKIRILQNRICEGYGSAPGLKEMLELYDRVSVIHEAEVNQEQSDWHGVNMLIPKETIAQHGRGWPEHFGENAGKGVRRGEDMRAWRLLEGGDFTREVPPDEALIDVVDEVIASLSASGYDPVLVFVNAWDAYSEMLDLNRYEQAMIGDQDELSEIRGGRYQGCDVFRLRIERNSSVLIFDPREFADWIQIVPTSGDGILTQAVVCKTLRFSVQFVDEEFARELLAQRPDEFWKEDEAGERVPEDEAIRELRKQAQLELYSSMRLRVEDRDSCVLLQKVEVDAS